MMQMQFKPMLYIGIISIPLLMWVYYYIPLTSHPILHDDLSLLGRAA